MTHWFTIWRSEKVWLTHSLTHWLTTWNQEMLAHLKICSLYTPSRFCFQLQSDLVIRVYCVLAGCQHPTDCLFQGLQRQDKLLLFILRILMIMIFMITLTLIWVLVLMMRMDNIYGTDCLSYLPTNLLLGSPVHIHYLCSCHHIITILLLLLSLYCPYHFLHPHTFEV